ncbi:MAG: PepSY domain-containing protein [Cystobacter sp.]
MRMNNLLPTFVLMIGLAAGAASASKAGEIKMLAQTKISLQQAIDAAQRHQGGQALEASLDDDSFKPVYEVTLVKDSRVYDVWVDGVDGKVVGAREDVKD